MDTQRGARAACSEALERRTVVCSCSPAAGARALSATRELHTGLQKNDRVKRESTTSYRAERRRRDCSPSAPGARASGSRTRAGSSTGTHSTRRPCGPRGGAAAGRAPSCATRARGSEAPRRSASGALCDAFRAHDARRAGDL